MTSSSVRPARLDDADALWPLVQGFATSFVPRRTAFDATFPTLVDHDDTLLVVAVATGARESAGVVGYLLARTHLTFLANGPVCWVEEVMVDPARRRSGIGAALMVHAEEWAAHRGAAYVALASRRAGDFYRTLGYTDSATFFKKTPSMSRSLTPRRG